MGSQKTLEQPLGSNECINKMEADNDSFVHYGIALR